MKRNDDVRIGLWTAGLHDIEEVERSISDLGFGAYRLDSFGALWDHIEAGLDLLIVPVKSAARVLSYIRGVWLGSAKRPPVVTVASPLDMDEYLVTMEQGTFDCVVLPIKPEEFKRIMSRALEAREHEHLLLPA